MTKAIIRNFKIGLICGSILVFAGLAVFTLDNWKNAAAQTTYPVIAAVFTGPLVFVSIY